MHRICNRALLGVLAASILMTSCATSAAPNAADTPIAPGSSGDPYAYVRDYDPNDSLVVGGLELRFATNMDELRRLYWITVVTDATSVLSKTPHVLSGFSGLPVYIGPKRRDLPGECNSIVLGGCAFKDGSGNILGIYLVDDDLEPLGDHGQWQAYGLRDVSIALHELGHIHSWLQGRLERFAKAVGDTPYPLPDQYGRRGGDEGGRGEEYAQLFMYWILAPTFIMQWDGIDGPRTQFFASEFQQDPAKIFSSS